MNSISKEGEKFILDLNLYLMSTGRSEKEIKDFIEEAEEHLILGEQEGKTVKDIFGDSSEEYAKAIAREIPYDKKDMIETILIFVLGLGAWIFLSKINNKVVTMSLVEAILTPVISIITLFLIFAMSRKFAFKEKKWGISLFIIFTLYISTLVVIGLVGRNMPQAIILNRLIVNILIVILFIALLIVSKRLDVWSLMLPFLWYIVVIIENFSNITFPDNVIVKIAPIALVFILIRVETKRMTKE